MQTPSLYLTFMGIFTKKKNPSASSTHPIQQRNLIEQILHVRCYGKCEVELYFFKNVLIILKYNRHSVSMLL